jgi:hypothetical protein
MYFVRMPSANAHGCARVFNEGNFVASVFDVFFNNTGPTTQFPQRSSHNAVPTTQFIHSVPTFGLLNSSKAIQISSFFGLCARSGANEITVPKAKMGVNSKLS